MERQPPLERGAGLIVEPSDDGAFLLEHELAAERDGPGVVLARLEAERLQLVDDVGADRVAILGGHPELPREVHVLLQLRLGALPQGFDFVRAFEFS